MIGIIDYGMGNLRSVQKAFELLGAEAVILAGPEGPGGVDLSAVAKLVLPGVGAFGDGIEHLRQRGWVEPIKAFVASGRPFLGICLGMQLIFESSEEDAPSPNQPVSGLGLLPGRVVRFRPPGVPAGLRLKVPHMGWNTLAWRREDPLLKGLAQESAVYFVHSYYVKPMESAQAPITSAVSDYGGPFTASIWRDNIWATQFHPEKSQRVGQKILANFVRL